MTKKYGIIGNPIKHSLSPTLHNYWFDKYKIDATYSVIETSESELKNVVKNVRDKNLSGINITLPYKQKIVPHLDVLVNDEDTGSVNIILRRRHYCWREHRCFRSTSKFKRGGQC